MFRSKSQTTVTSKSTTVWTCLDCGNKFRDISDIEKDIESTLKGAKIVSILCYVSAVLFFIEVVCLLGLSSSMTVLPVVFCIVFVILGILE